jgi:serine/threonine protein kinase
VVHEIGETDDGRPFIAIEYVEGLTLRQRLRSQSMKLGDVLDIGIQIADALSAAHEAGIVHRDIKPENIMIRPEGYVKILDFGLAKLTERHKGATHTTMSTLLFDSSPGTVMGTAAYMSPEQARGVAVDERTDIWGLGVVLYEMASGRPPFVGETPTDVVVAIVEKDQPPLSRHVEGTPPELERIVRKALRKDPNERYQIVKELAIDLRSLRREMELNSLLDRSLTPGTGTSSDSEYARASTGRESAVHTDELKAARTVIHKPSIASNRLWLTLLAGVAIIIAAASYGIYRMNQRPEVRTRVPFERIEVTKLTTNGNASRVAISADGKYVAYVTSESGKESLWLRQVAINSTAQLVPPREGRYMGAAFSPDGDFVYFGYASSNRNDAGQIYRLPVLGIGAVATRIDAPEGPRAVSRDNQRVAFIRYDLPNRTDHLIVTNAGGGGEQTVASRVWPQHLGWDFLSKPEWSADDKSLLLAMISSDPGSSDEVAVNYSLSIYEKNLVTGAEQTIPLTPDKFDELGHVSLYPNGSGLILPARAHGASFLQIWQLLRDGSKRSITSDLSDYRELSLRGDGSAFVTVQTQTLSRIWTLRKGETKATPITTGTSRYFDLHVAPDDKIVYASDASGVADIFEIAATGGEPRQLTFDGGRNYAPVVSPDNRYLVFHSNRAGVFQIWRADRDGSGPKQLTFSSSESTWPKFSPDGKWIFFHHFEPRTLYSIWRISIDGGTPEKVTEGASIRPAVSPDGKLIAFWYNDEQQTSRWLLKVAYADSGATFKTFEVAQTVQVQWDSPMSWSPDGRYVTYIDHSGGIDNVWGQPIDGGALKQLTNFEDSRILSFDWLKDGGLVSSRGVITSDVVLIKDAGR